MRLRGRLALGLAVMGAAGCGLLLVSCNTLLGNDAWTLAPEAGHDAAPKEASSFNTLADTGIDRAQDVSADVQGETGSDTGGPPPDARPPPDANEAEAAIDASDAPVDTGVDAGLSPLLVVPPAGQACDPTQGDAQCPMNTTCRISSTTWGTCDTYTPNAIAGFPCTVDSDCDATLQCYNGVCHVLCVLGTTCSGGCECFNVGSVDMGLCCPGL